MSRNSVRLLVLAAAVAVLYGFGLGRTPAHFHHDEAIISLQATSIAATGRDFEGRLLPQYFHMPHVDAHAWFQPTIVYVTALFLQVLPANETSFRIPSVAIATLNVLLMFLVARRLFRSDQWGLIAAILLAATPTHFILGRVALDYVYPLPFALGWLLAIQIYFERGHDWRLFAATSVLGFGFYSFIASVVMMPVYLTLTLFLLGANRRLTVRTTAVALAGFAWPLVLLLIWLWREPSFIGEVLRRYSVDAAPSFHFSAVAERVTLYWSFFNPAFLFLIGGFTQLTNTTRVTGVFLVPFIVLIPLGIIHILTNRRSALSMVVLLGFALAPTAAVLTVNEPYAIGREPSVMVFAVLIAVHGLQRAWSWNGTAARVFAIALIVLLPLNFAFFLAHYFGPYRGYSAAAFRYNHRDGLAAIIERVPRDQPVHIFLTAGRDRWMDAYWRLQLAESHREDLLQRTTYFDSTQAMTPEIPPGSLVLVSVDDKDLLDRAKAGQFSEVMHADEPADEPVFFLLRRNP